MASKGTKVKIAGTSIVVVAVILGALAVYKNRKAIKCTSDKTKDNLIEWKNDKLRSTLDKAEDVIEDLRYSTVTEKDIAWG
jgi:hypothetical protein